MDGTLSGKRLFPGVSTGKVVARFRLLGIGAESTERGSRLGHPTATVPPREDEIADFAQPPWPEIEDEMWVWRNHRRLDLIDRKYATGLNATEEAELANLQVELANALRAMAPLPFDSLRRLEALAEAAPDPQP
jgi:hypothetical protein